MGSKISRRTSDAGKPLSKEMIDELCRDTGFTEEELLSWYTNFHKDCPDGRLTYKQFEHQYSKIMGKPTHKTADFIRHMFNVYDHDKNQFIDFKEFVMALSVASVVNRLRLIETIFSIFDLDNDGRITKDEMTKMLHTLLDVTSTNKKRRNQHGNADDARAQASVQKRIDEAFNELNTNADDHITKEEFIEWYTKTGILADVKPNGIHVHDTSRIQELDKKTRKAKKQQTTAAALIPDETARASLVRHLSRMTEHREPITDDESDEETVDDATSFHGTESTVCDRSSSSDGDSHYSKENERWQHLFNSVIGQIRAQRAESASVHQADATEPPAISHFNSWKRQGEERATVEYLRQISTDSTPSPDVMTIRF